VSAIIETSLSCSVPRVVITALLYGNTLGTYKVYVDMPSRNYVIYFENGEDATMYELKGMDDIVKDMMKDEVLASSF